MPKDIGSLRQPATGGGGKVGVGRSPCDERGIPGRNGIELRSRQRDIGRVGHQPGQPEKRACAAGKRCEADDAATEPTDDVGAGFVRDAAHRAVALVGRKQLHGANTAAGSQARKGM